MDAGGRGTGWVGTAGQTREEDGNGCGVSFVLKMTVRIVAKFCEYTKLYKL